MIERITIAALLHDIGKFYQRGEENLSKDGSLYKKHENLLTLICPETANNQLGYKHAFWTFKFFDDFKNDFRNFMQNLNQNDEISTDQDKSDEDNLINLAIYHHNPHSINQALIQLADWWSSGLDRRDSIAEEKIDNSTTLNFGKYGFRERPLETIFQAIKLSKSKNKNQRHHYPLKALSLDKKDIFPKALEQENIHDLSKAYKELYKEFKTDFEKVPKKNFRSFMDTLDHILKKYTWCIPSSTNGMANVSLYDHLKTTAGIAACLYQYKDAHPEAFHYNSSDHRLRIEEGHYPVRLTCVDISGIQSFIYNIYSKKAAVSLKGRSYYLHLLMETVLREIYNDADIQLTRIQTIYSSGGKAYFFLPNTEKVNNALIRIKSKIEKQIWETHKLTLYVCIGSSAFRYKFDKQLDGRFDAGIVGLGEMPIKMEDLWKQVSEEAAKEKSQRYRSYITSEEGFASLFGEGDQGIELEYTDKHDATDGQPLYSDDWGKIDDDTYVSKNNKDLIDLGNILKDVDFNFSFSEVHVFESYKNHRDLQLSLRPLRLQTGFHLFDDKNLVKDDTTFRKIKSSADVHCSVINRTDFMTFAVKGDNASYGFSFYGGNKQPINKNGYRKTFDQMATGSKLGILRMDVDNLGSIFIRGLDENLRTFSAYATLSSQLDLFFSGYLNTIRNREIFKDHVSILYSGGDDVFAVGRWDRVLDFGLVVRDAFKEFTGQNEDIDLSAGFIRTGGKFPISKSAQLAGDAEKAAKQFQRMVNKQETNRAAIHLFGVSVGWEEWKCIIDYKVLLEKIVVVKEGGKSLLHKIQQAKLIKDQQEDPNIKVERDYSYLWQLLYFLTRYTNNDNKDDIDLLSKDLLKTNQGRSLDLMTVAARWVELLND